MTRANDIDPNGSFERAFAEAAGTVAQERPRPAINRITRDDVQAFNHTSQMTNGGLLNDYQTIATKSAIYPGKGTPFGLMYAALGLAEAGEVQNKTKKAYRDDNAVEFLHAPDFGVYIENVHVIRCNPITPERRAEIIKELGGVLWYISATCNEIGASLSEVALANLTELAGRTERGTLQGSGDDR